MFFSNNNFVEIQARSMKMPFTKVVMDKVVIIIISLTCWVCWSSTLLNPG